MGTLFRSQPMSKGQLFLQADNCYDTIAALGELGVVQFCDLNEEVNAFQRKFVNEIRKCENMQRQLRYLEKEIENCGLKFTGEEAPDDKAPSSDEVDTLQTTLSRLEAEMTETAANDEKLRKLRVQYTEMREILTQSSVYFSEAQGHLNEIQPPPETVNLVDDIPLLTLNGQPDENQSALAFTAGVIPRGSYAGFERLIWRVCRGNVFLRTSEIEQPIEVPAEDSKKAGSSTTKIEKNVFIAFYQGDQLAARIKKICEGYGATVYPVPSDANARKNLLNDIKARAADVETVLNRGQEHRRQALDWLAAHFHATEMKVRKIKSIFNIMNKLSHDVNRKNLLIAEVWFPKSSTQEIRDALVMSARPGTMPAILNEIKAKDKPPTYFKTNKFTSAFQSIVDAYGVATYQEANPTPFAIITFPFLFAVMFGDFGHGILMACAAYAMIRWENPLKSYKAGGEIWDTMFGGRYVIMLMGLFSIYTGFVYNDWFSKPVTFGSSGWTLPPYETVNGTDLATLRTDQNFKFAYPIGVDPLWNMSENKLTFSNSFKMKMAVILGVCQMLFGIIMSFFNHTYFKRSLNIYCEFIPQVIFLTFIFGYLCCMIFYKWATAGHDFPNQSPPSLLLMLINMFLKFGSPPAQGEVLYGDAAGNTQAKFQSFLVVVAVICVPWMLLIKPFILKRRAQQSNTHLPVPVSHHEDDGDDHLADGAHAVASHTDEEDDEGHGDHGGGHGHDGPFNFGEIMVHQAIHTIEFCLGCISNTASYLRLWALSLAHAQLSEVLWEMVLHSSFGNPIMLYIGFAVWAALTIAILLIMEGLSAFLHALRLHWVEFQNKFYDGNGVKFSPYSFTRILTAKSEDDLDF